MICQQLELFEPVGALAPPLIVQPEPGDRLWRELPPSWLEPQRFKFEVEGWLVRVDYDPQEGNTHCLSLLFESEVSGLFCPGNRREEFCLKYRADRRQFVDERWGTVSNLCWQRLQRLVRSQRGVLS